MTCEIQLTFKAETNKLIKNNITIKQFHNNIITNKHKSGIKLVLSFLSLKIKKSLE